MAAKSDRFSKAKDLTYGDVFLWDAQKLCVMVSQLNRSMGDERCTIVVICGNILDQDKPDPSKGELRQMSGNLWVEKVELDVFRGSDCIYRTWKHD